MEIRTTDEMLDILASARREIVQNVDRETAVEQSFGEMAADETGSSGDQSASLRGQRLGRAHLPAFPSGA